MSSPNRSPHFPCIGPKPPTSALKGLHEEAVIWHFVFDPHGPQNDRPYQKPRSQAKSWGELELPVRHSPHRGTRMRCHVAGANEGSELYGDIPLSERYIEPMVECDNGRLTSAR